MERDIKITYRLDPETGLEHLDFIGPKAAMYFEWSNADEMDLMMREFQPLIDAANTMLETEHKVRSFAKDIPDHLGDIND